MKFTIAGKIAELKLVLNFSELTRYTPSIMRIGIRYGVNMALNLQQFNPTALAELSKQQYLTNPVLQNETN